MASAEGNNQSALKCVVIGEMAFECSLYLPMNADMN
jgi:hypothetical protein